MTDGIDDPRLTRIERYQDQLLTGQAKTAGKVDRTSEKVDLITTELFGEATLDVDGQVRRDGGMKKIVCDTQQDVCEIKDDLRNGGVRVKIRLSGAVWAAIIAAASGIIIAVVT